MRCCRSWLAYANRPSPSPAPADAADPNDLLAEVASTPEHWRDHLPASSNPIRLLSLPTDHEVLPPLVQIHQVVAMPTREALLTWRDMKLAGAPITSRTSDVPLRATEAA